MIVYPIAGKLLADRADFTPFVKRSDDVMFR
jgi:hypothetical protein